MVEQRFSPYSTIIVFIGSRQTSAYKFYRGCPMNSTGIFSLKFLLLSCCFCHSAYAAFPFSELQYVIIDEYKTLASESIS